MKRLFPLLLAFVFVACKKDESATETALPEQNYKDVSYGADAAQRMDVYLPANRTAASTKVLIMIHGGGWYLGDKADMNEYVNVLKSRLSDYAVFNINYRLAAFPSTNTFPTQENDVKAAVDFALGKAGEYRFNTEKLAVLGASSGGHLALQQSYRYTTPKVKAVVDYFGPTDMVALYNSYTSQPQTQLGIQALMGGTPATNPTLYQTSSPLTWTTSNVPPTLILHGTADPIVPYAQSTALKAKLDGVGVSAKLITYAGAGHGDWNAATFEDSYQQVINFLKEKNP